MKSTNPNLSKGAGKMKKKSLILYLSGGLGILLAIGLCIFLLNDKGSLDNSEQQMSEAIASSESESMMEIIGGQTEEAESTEIVMEPTEEEPQTLQVVMVGDMLMHERIIESGKKEDGSYNFDHLFTHVKDFITEADLAIVNQETILGGPDYGYTGYPSFNSPYELGDSLVDAGFDVVLHATNHTLDKGKKAVINCMNYWETNHPEMAYLGIHQSEEAQDEIYVYEQDGFRIAILNYTYGMNGIAIPKDMPYIVNMMEEEQIREDIRKAEEIADFTIVCPHWGTEYKLEETSEQRNWAELFLEEGVDLVLGAHPHVIEPIEWLSDEEGHEMLVYYSLGNFVNGTSSTGHGVTNRMVGGIADVTLERGGDGTVKIAEYGAVPIVCHIGKGTEYTVYYMEDYTEELASKNLILSQDDEFSKELCESIFEEVWGDDKEGFSN